MFTGTHIEKNQIDIYIYMYIYTYSVLDILYGTLSMKLVIDFFLVTAKHGRRVEKGSCLKSLLISVVPNVVGRFLKSLKHCTRNSR